MLREKQQQLPQVASEETQISPQQHQMHLRQASPTAFAFHGPPAAYLHRERFHAPAYGPRPPELHTIPRNAGSRAEGQDHSSYSIL